MARFSGWLVIGACLWITTGARAQDISQWRGANRDARLVGFTAPVKWPKELTRKWRVTVGEGHASPLLVGEDAFLFSREGDQEVIRGLRLQDGKEKWRYAYPAPYTMNPAAQGHGKGPKSTPIFSQGRLYTLGISGILTCLDAKKGKLLWHADFASDYPKTSPLFGAAMSPLVVNGLVIAHVGGQDNGAITAFDAGTGERRWRWVGDGPGYASPIVLNQGGVRQIITQTQKMCVGLDAATGKLLWSLPFTTPYDQNAVTPVAAGNLVIFAGLQKPTFAVRIQKSGDSWMAERVWETRDATLYMSSPVVSGDRVYGLSERRSGQMFSLDPATGKVLWTGEGRLAENISVWDGGPYLVALTTDADLVLFKKSGDTLTEAMRYRVADSPTWASPAIRKNQILIKDKDSLTLWTLPTTQKPTR